MKQDEVVRDLLQKAPPSPGLGTSLPEGFKAVSSLAVGSVDLEAVTTWVEANGGRAEHLGSAPLQETGPDRDAPSAEPADLFWVVPESALGL